MKLRLALAAATCLALPLAAHAQPVTGPYVSLEGGVDFLMPVNFSETLGGGGGKAQYRPGYAGEVMAWAMVFACNLAVMICTPPCMPSTFRVMATIG